MTTSDVSTISVEKLPGDGDVISVDTIDSASYEGTTGIISDGDNLGANVGTEIRDSGTGNGSDGGFNVGGQYLAFQGTGTGDNNSRFASLSPIDTSQVDTLTITAIVGNDVNGGEDPDLASECLFVMYKTPAMANAQFLLLKPDGSAGEGSGIIITTPLSHNGGLNNYSISVPEYARAEGTQFVLLQNFNSGVGFDHFGVTKINFQRKAPMNVVVPLDNPEASSFIRSAPPKSTSTPKKRKKAVDDKLQASDDYTGSRFGDEFPGREVRVGGEDPFASAKIGDDVEPSPQSKDDVKKTFAASRLKSALGKPESKPTTSPEEKLADILKTTILKPNQPKSGKDLSTFKSDGENKKTEVAVSTEARNSVKNSPEISEMIKGMTAEQKKAAIEKMYPEKAQEILDTADNNVIKSALEQGISATVVDGIAEITQPLIGAKTSANAFNEYNDFLGKVAKDPNTPGATYENPVNMSNQIEKADMNDLTTTINSGNYQSIVNSIRATNDENAQKELKKQLESMISDTIGNNFGLDNFMHNNVKVNLPHLLETGKTKLTKGYKFTTGGSIEGIETATSWDDGWFYGAKLISDALGLEYDTLGTGKVPFPQTFNVGGIDFAPGNIINIPVWTATTFGPAIIAKLGLTNTKNFDNSSYKSPMMFYEVDVPGKYSVDSKGNTIQSAKPSAAEQIKKTVSNVLNQGKEVVSNLFSFGAEDENAPQREDFPMGRSGAKKYSDAMKLYNAAKSVSDSSEASGIDSTEYGMDPARYWETLPFPPLSDENAALIAAAKSGGDAEMDALAKAHAEMMKQEIIAMQKAEAGGASPESLMALSVKQYEKRKPLEDALEIDSPVPPMPSEPIEPDRDDFPNTISGDKQYQDAKKAFDAKQASKEISELSNEDAQNRVFEIYDEDSDLFNQLYDPLYENDPIYKEYMGIYDQMEKNATPEGQELLKQQYEALEFTLQGYASKFVDTVLVQPGGINPFGYENTSNQAVTYAGKKDAPAGVYFWGMTDREQFEMAGVDLAKYDEAEAFVEPYEIGNLFGFVESQPDYIEAQAEDDRTMAIYQASSNISNSAWASYEAHADKYAGREFILPLEQAEYDRVTKRAEELYKTYEEAENKSYDDMMTMLDASRKRSDIFTKYTNKIDDSFDILNGAKEKRNEYWDNYEQELKSKMDVILSKINGDYDYNEDLRALDPQIEELFNRINKQFLNLYNNLDDILAEPEEGPEFDPFKDELKPGLGAEDGDELALFGKKPPNPGEKQGRATHINIINWWQSGGMMGKKPEGWSDQDIQNYINKFYLNKSSSKPQASSDPRAAFAGTGDDAATFAFDGTELASTFDLMKSGQVPYMTKDQIDKILVNPKFQKLLQDDPDLLPILQRMRAGRSSNVQVAHFVPRGDNLSEVMLVKKTKLQRPKQFFKEPNQFFNVNDIKPEFPENPPPKLDPNTGMHPEYGKKAKRYGKLDPISANSMPPTGDPEIDAVVKKQKTNESKLFEKLKNKSFFNQDDIKPEFPENPPPKLDSKTGMHPQYGKKANRFTKLDPISADSMPLTGDPETDAIVKKQKNKKNFKEWSQQLDSMWKSDWKNELKEQMTTSDTFITIIPGQGDVDLNTTGLGYTEDGIHQLQNIEPMTNVDDPTNAGKKFGRTHGYGGNTYGAINQYDTQAKADAGIEGTYWDQAVIGDLLDDNSNVRLSDYVWPFDRGATQAESDAARAASKVRGQNDCFRAVYPTNTFGNRHKATPVITNTTVGTDDDYNTAGLSIQFGAGADTRAPKFFVPNPVNTSEIDTVQILASLPDSDSITSAGSQLQLFYWSGDKPGFQSLYPETSGGYPFTKNQNDGWRPIAMKPNGETDSSVSSNLIDIIKPADYLGHGVINKFSIKIPEWCRTTSTRFMYVQLNGSGSRDRLRIYSIGYQRRNGITINTTLEDDISSAYVRAGINSNLTSAERKKKLEERLRASREYMLKSLGFADLFNDEIKISDVVSNTFDYEAVMQGSGKFGNSRFNDLVSLEKRQKAAGIRKPQQTKRRGKFRGYQRTGRDSKGMTTRARVNPNDIIGSI